MPMEPVIPFLDENEVTPCGLIKSQVTELGLPEIAHLSSYSNDLQEEVREDDLGADICEYRSNTRSSPFESSAESMSLELSTLTFDKSPRPVTLQSQRDWMVIVDEKPKKNSNKRPYSGLNLDLPSYYALEGKMKLERNRISARECRLRKKMYVANLEHQIKDLKLELNQCRKELREYKTKEQQQLLTNFKTSEVTLENLNPSFTKEDEKSNTRNQLNSYFVS